MKKKVNPQDEIKSYSLKEGNYSITVKVLEANDLVSKNKGIFGFGAAQICSPQVEVEVYKRKKRTKAIKNQSNAVFNQGWTFYFKGLKLDELQDIAVKLSVFDKGKLTSHVIGSYELDLTSIYFQHNHEYFHTWLTLTDPTDQIEGPTGYMLANIAVLGPGDEPAIHDIENAKKATAGKEKALVPTKVDQTGHQIEINIYRAENLPCLDSNLESIDAFVVAKFGSSIVSTNIISSRNPEWNQCLKLQCMLPCQSKQIILAVYDMDDISSDDLVGQIKINLADIQYKRHVPRWANLYGAPTIAKGKDADLMNFYGSSLGSHYRGRILYSCTSYNKEDPKTICKSLQFSFPNNPVPQTKMRSYLLWVDIIEGNEIPDKNSDMIIHASIGPYMLQSQPKINILGQVNWLESLEERKVIFPDDPEQIPDLIFYLTDQNKEDRRMCFNRVKATKILKQQNEFDPEVDHETILVELKEDRSLDLVKDDEFAGFLVVKVSLLRMRPKKERVFINEEVKLKMMQDRQDYQLRVQLYQGRGLPPADETGGCDPFVKIKCAGRVGTSKAKEKTLNPGWFETVKLDQVGLPTMESLMKTKHPTKGMFLTVYDCDEKLTAKNGKGEVGNILMQKIDQMDLKKQIYGLYSKIMNKPGEESHRSDENSENQQESKLSLSRSKVQQQQIELTPREQQSPNKSLNDSGIIIQDPDKVDKDLIGRIWIPLEPLHVKFRTKNESTPLFPSQSFDILYRRPKWYPIKYDATGEYTGQVLLSYTLVPQGYSDIIKSRDNLFPSYDMKKLSFFLIGVREIDQEALGKKLQNISASLDVSGDSSKAYQTNEMKVQNSGGNANQYVEFNIKVPKNKSFDPVIDVFLWDCSKGEPYEFLGFGSLPFKDVPFLKYSKLFDHNAEIESEMSLAECLREAIFLEKKMNDKNQKEEVVEKEVKEELKKPREIYKRTTIPSEDESRFKTQENGQLLMKNNNDDDIILEENEEEVEEEDRINYLPGRTTTAITSKTKPAQEEEIEIVKVKEGNYQGQTMRVSQAYPNTKNIAENGNILTNLAPRPLNLSKNNQNASEIEQNQQKMIRDNDFLFDPPNIDPQQMMDTEPSNEATPLKAKGGSGKLNNKRIETKSSKAASEMQGENFGKKSSMNSNQMGKKQSLQDGGGGDDQSNEGNELDQTINSDQNSNKDQESLVKRAAPAPKTKAPKKGQDFEIQTFSPPESLSFSVKSHSKKSLHYEDIPKEGKIVKSEDNDPAKKNILVVDSKMLALFKKKGGIQILEYEDYDTDDDEDLDITPEWKKFREIFLSEFEDQYKPSRKLTCIPIKRGQSRGAKKDLFSFDPPSEPQEFAVIKCLFVDAENPNFLGKVEELKKLLKERSYYARIYITRGKNIGGEGASPDSYLILKMGDKTVNLKEKTLQKDTNNPNYYIQYDFECKLPGSAVIQVEVWNDVLGSDDMIGSTSIDMENRLFTGKWLKYERKPFENRNIFPENENVSMGNLEMWVELIPKSAIKLNPPLAITRPPRYEMEIRVIVWETKDCVLKDEAEKCNDIYVRVGLQNKPEDQQETDIHWRCRANGSFNWRMKFKQTFPLTNDEYGGDKLSVILLDKDLVMSDDIIGSCIIDLNQHKLVDKCVKRQKPVQLQMRELNRKQRISDKIWYQVYNPLVRDKAGKPIIQGQVCLSVEIMPIKIAQEKKNGFGRDSPNNYPPLSEPAGRMKFDLLHPFEFLKTIIGPDLYKKFCGFFIMILCIVFFFTFGWIFFSQLITNAIV